jgi:hypothetical protein
MIEEGRRVGGQNFYDISVGEGIMFIAEVCGSDGPYFSNVVKALSKRGSLDNWFET